MAGNAANSALTPSTAADDQMNAPMATPTAAYEALRRLPLAARCDTSKKLAPGVSNAATCSSQMAAKMESIEAT